MSLATRATKSLAEPMPQLTNSLAEADSGKTLTTSGGGGGGLSFAPVPLPSGDRSAKQRMEMYQNDEMFSANDSATSPNVVTGRISDEEIRNSLMVEAKRRRYWNSKTIAKMLFEEVSQGCCYHYVLESFTETRSTAEAVESSSSAATLGIVRSRTGENLTSPHTNKTFAATLVEQIHHHGATGQAISNIGSAEVVKTVFQSDFGQHPWDFDVQPDDDFVNQIKILEMPNSQRQATCNSCKGDTLVHCFHCRGSGNDKCTYCRGTGMKAGVAHPAVYTHPIIGGFPGHDHAMSGSSANRGYPFANASVIRPALLGAQRDKPYAAGTPVHFMAKAGLPPPGIGQHDLCIFCHGRGIRDCQHCKGQGKKCCLTCGGAGHVRVYTKLKVAFAVECTDYYTSCEVPEILLRQASGELIFSETRPYVQPIRENALNEINEVSRRFCAAHLKKLLDSCRVLKQRHCVEAIEVAKVRFRLGSKEGFFYVYGRQRLCYIPEGPSRCSIM